MKKLEIQPLAADSNGSAGEFVKIIREQRKRMEAIASVIPLIGRTPQLILAEQNLIESRMFLGDLLGVFGELYPYPESANPENTKIEKTADTDSDYQKIVVEIFNDTVDPKAIDQLIKRVKLLRSWIKQEKEFLLSENYYYSVYRGSEKSTPAEDNQLELYYQSASSSCAKANYWLGMELGQIAKDHPGYLSTDTKQTTTNEAGSPQIENVPVNPDENNEEKKSPAKTE